MPKAKEPEWVFCVVKDSGPRSSASRLCIQKGLLEAFADLYGGRLEEGGSVRLLTARMPAGDAKDARRTVLDFADIYSVSGMAGAERMRGRLVELARSPDAQGMGADALRSVLDRLSSEYDVFRRGADERHPRSARRHQEHDGVRGERERLHGLPRGRCHRVAEGVRRGSAAGSCPIRGSAAVPASVLAARVLAGARDEGVRDRARRCPERRCGRRGGRRFEALVRARSAAGIRGARLEGPARPHSRSRRGARAMAAPRRKAKPKAEERTQEQEPVVWDPSMEEPSAPVAEKAPEPEPEKTEPETAEPVPMAEAPEPETAEPAPEPERSMRDRLVEAVGAPSPDCVPTLIQFEQRSGRPCTVLVEADEAAVRRAWAVWSAENGTGQETFVMALLDAMDAWPARIMRPCTLVRLG